MTELQRIISCIGADEISAVITEPAKKNLTELLNGLPQIRIPEASMPINHDEYLKLRQQIAAFATVAAIAGDSRLEAITEQWVTLQQRYAKQVIKNVNEEIKTQKGLLEEYDKELAKGQADRDYLTKLGKKTVIEMNEEELTKVVALKRKISQLDETQREREQLHRSIASVSKVETTLRTLIESGIEAVHYRIPSAEEISKRLGNDAYNGPDFDPFIVSRKAAITNLFSRTSAPPSLLPNDKQRDLNLETLPKLLEELYLIYEHITKLTSGTAISPAYVKEKLGIEVIGTKGLANYLEYEMTVFCLQKVERAGARVFMRRETGQRLDKKSFIDYMIKHLQTPDLAEVNDFYFKKALALLREQPPAYEGFTKEHLNRIAENQGLPVSNIYVARNLRTTAGVEEISPERSKSTVYRFKEIIPTARQIECVEEAIEEFGVTRFASRDVVRKVTELHSDYRILSIVVEKVLEREHEKWRLRIASNVPLQYQKINQPMEPAKPRTLLSEKLM